MCTKPGCVSKIKLLGIRLGHFLEWYGKRTAHTFGGDKVPTVYRFFGKFPTRLCMNNRVRLKSRTSILQEVVQNPCVIRATEASYASLQHDEFRRNSRPHRAHNFFQYISLFIPGIRYHTRVPGTWYIIWFMFCV